MVREALAKFKMSKKVGPQRAYYFSPRIYLPMKLVSDSSFPFRDEELQILVKIRGRKLLIEKPSTRALEKFGKPRQQPQLNP